MNKQILKYAVLNSILTALYVTGVALFLTYVTKLFNGPDNFLAPLAMILLFVFSAALTASLVLGRPVLWYLDGKKKEAISLFTYTLGCLLVLIVITFYFIFFFSTR